jgi:hypothetical protein
MGTITATLMDPTITMPTDNWDAVYHAPTNTIYTYGGTTLNKYNLTTGVWSACASSATNTNGKLHLLGDFLFTKRTSAASTIAYKYNIYANTWATVAVASSASSTGFVIGNTAYMLRYGTGALYTYSSTGTESTKATLAAFTATNQIAAASVGTYGYSGTASAQSQWWMYDSVANTWTQKASAPMALGSSRATAIGTNIYAFLTDNNIYKYDTLTNTWSLYITMPIQSDGSGLVAVGSTLYKVSDNSSTNELMYEIVERLTRPTALSTQIVGGSTVRLTWTNNAGDAQNIVIERKRSDASSYTVLDTVPAATATYDDTTVSLTTYGYWYRVKAIKVG